MISMRAAQNKANHMLWIAARRPSYVQLEMCQSGMTAGIMLASHCFHTVQF
jgi:hypothetical protein